MPCSIRYCLFLVLTLGLAARAAAADRKLPIEKLKLDASHAKAEAAGAELKIAFDHRTEWPGVTMLPPEGGWNFAGFGYLTVQVKNLGNVQARIGCRIDDQEPRKSKTWLQGDVTLEPGETKTIRVGLRGRQPESLKDKLFGMRGFPGGFLEGKQGIDIAHISSIRIFAAKPKHDHLVLASDLRLQGTPPVALPADLTKLFPMIDTFGQYVHTTWPGKIERVEDLAARRADEARDLAAHPGPEGRNQYGGWLSGPKLAATGRFRAEKYQGKWWLVDPEGRLFWSHGIDCVRRTCGVTPITDRKDWYADLPKPGTPLAKFYGKGWGAAHGYYEKLKYETFDFSGANLFRKYGDDWRNQFAEMAHQRLRSWGLNTIANWSDADVYNLRKTPYCVPVYGKARAIEGSAGYWGKFVDPFDPGFAAGMQKAFEKEKGTTLNDPWCVGYFLGNELSWGDDLSLAVGTLQSPADQPAKKVFVDDLRKKYDTIDKLNAAWGANYTSWDALLTSTTAPDKKKAAADLGEFYSKVADEFFRLCRAAVKQASPDALYLGCRFAWVNERAARAGEKYCDVVSYNRYTVDHEDFKLPEGVDKPVVIGEFHFGALDRGMFHTGLRPVNNQDERAAAYEHYVRSALKHPNIVGTHWFQYADQATTGRSDGENYQIGFVDVCDTPYPETITAARRIGREMYEYRSRP